MVSEVALRASLELQLRYLYNVVMALAVEGIYRDRRGRFVATETREDAREIASDLLLGAIDELHDASLADLYNCAGCEVLRLWRPVEFVRCPGCGTERRYQTPT